MSLEGILSRHFRPATLLAAEPVKRGLLADLRAQKRFNQRIYILLLGVICVLALVLIGGLVADVLFARPDRSKILAGAGVTVSVLLAWMHRIVRELAELNLVITVMSHSSEAEIQQWIPRLAPRLLSAPEDGARQRKRTPRD